LSAQWQALWYRDAPPPLALRALAWLFGVGVRLRGAAYARRWLRAERLERPVIVVGNLSVGGSGKTPLVIWLVTQLRAAGLAPGIVLRGYGGRAARGRAPTRVRADSEPAQVGDEALLLCQRTGAPVAVGRQRMRAARLLLAEGVNVIVADDGLQHLALARDFEIVVIDGERGHGNGLLLPAGPLREPPARSDRADAVVINGEGRYWRRVMVETRGRGMQAPITMRLRGDRLQSLQGGSAPLALASFAGRRVHAVAGIGNPQRFFSQLRTAGLELIEHAFPDHHCFRRSDFDFGDTLPVLMTEKDAVKCRSLAELDAWYLPVTAEFEAAEAGQLLGRLRKVTGD
jgi:tetraacyldisaccharide 4'-kinase